MCELSDSGLSDCILGTVLQPGRVRGTDAYYIKYHWGKRGHGSLQYKVGRSVSLLGGAMRREKVGRQRAAKGGRAAHGRWRGGYG